MSTSGDDIAPPPGPPAPPAPPSVPGGPDPGGAAPPPSPPPAAPPGGRRGLMRSTDRYVGGVAGGLADALDVDPIIVRLALVVGTLYMPWLVVVYAFAWLALPDERTGATLLRSARTPEGWRPVVGIAALGVGVTMLAPDLGPGGDTALTTGVILAGIGILLVLRHPGEGSTASPPAGTDWTDPGREVPPPDPEADPTADQPLGGRAIAPLERLVHDRFPRRRHPPSHLGWLGLSALLVLVGALAAVDRGVEPVKPGVAVSLGLLLVGVVLLVAAWRGRARLLILPGLALLPLWVGWSLSDVPRYDHDGDVSYVVSARDDLRRAYEHGYGQMDVDLRSMAFRKSEHRSLRLGLTGGVARLYVPAEVHLVINGDVGLGRVEVYQSPYYGQVDATSGVVARDVDLREGDPLSTCFEQDVYGPEGYDSLGNYVPPEVVRTENRTPFGEPCEPEPPVKDPPVLEVTLDVGVGTVEVHREAA